MCVCACVLYVCPMNELCVHANSFISSASYCTCAYMYASMNYSSLKKGPRCYAKSPTAKDTFWLIPCRPHQLYVPSVVYGCAYTVVMEIQFELHVHNQKNCQWSERTFPVMGAKRGFCIFMASSVTMLVPSSTESPSSHDMLFTTPGIGACRM